MGKYVDFDKFKAERERETITVKIFGRKCVVPSDVPFYYMMKVIKLAEEQKGIPTSENLALLQEMFKPDDYKFITEHPRFTISDVNAIVHAIWLAGDDEEEGEDAPEEITEDSLAVAKTRARNPKKA